MVGVLAAILGIVLLDIGLGWNSRHDGKASARALVERIDENREPVLEVVDGLVAEWGGGLDEPLRAWSEVRCSVRDKLSDGDGPTTVVGQLQNCSIAVHHVYALPRGSRGPERAGLLTKTSPNSLDDGCEVSLVDEMSTAHEAADGTWNVVDLTWVDTAGEPVDEYESCRLPEAVGSRVQETASQPLKGRYFVTLQVYNQGESVSIGCGDRRIFWFGTCEAPDGAPYL